MCEVTNRFGAERTESLILGMIILRCLFDTQVEMSLRELDMRKELGKEAQVGSFNLGSYRWTR